MKRFIQCSYIFILLFAVQALAYQNGITGRTTSGCGGAGCHSGTPSNTTLTTSGPSSVLPSSTGNTFTLTIQNSTRPRAGCDIDFVNASNTVQSGLAVISGQGTTLSGNEIVHSTPKSLSGSASFQFNITAPSTPGVYTIRFAGNATSSSSSGDFTTTTRTFTVKGLTLTAPAAGAVFCAGNSVSVQWTSYGVTNVNIELSTNSGSTYTQVGTATSNDGANSSSFTLPGNTPPGNTYRIRVVDASATTLNSAMSGDATVGTGASITTQPSPATQAVCQGANVTLTVAATGGGVTYQWRKDATNVPGATNATLSLSNIAPSQGGVYDCVVSGTCGTPVTSSTATVTVNPAVTINTHPNPVSICQGANATFTIAASGGTLTYQWKKNGTAINGATNATYTVNSVTETDQGQYSCTVSGSCGTPVTSQNAPLQVSTPAQFTTQPADAAGCEGSTVTFTIAVANPAGVTYEWAKDGGTIQNGGRFSGASGTTLTITGVLPADQGNYSCRAIVAICQSTVVSNAATLNVNPKPAITTHPSNKTASTGTSTNFTVVATGNNLTYQWKKGTTNINGATSATYTIPSAQKSDEGSYSVVVTNNCGTVTSNGATLTVSDAPAPNITLSKGSLAFGKLRVGATSAEQTFVISNTGNAKLDISKIELGGTNKTDYTLTVTTPVSVPAKDSVVVKVTFSPKAVGARTADISITSNASAPSPVTLTGEGVARAISLNQVVFPSGQPTDVGSTRDTTVLLCNTTGANLVIQNATFEGDTSSFQVLVMQLPPFTIKPDSCVSIIVQFKPTKAGALSIKAIVQTSQGNDTVMASGTAQVGSSVQDGYAGGLNVYPNPANDVVTVTIPENQTTSEIQIVDALGRVQLASHVHGVTNNINISSLANGAYTIVVYANGVQRGLPIVVLR
ncbi:MAG: immunoglobulin domain-containing protein [Candidatus Kapabacteria bacterium]|nr:immunoglobulin domain-containing protein [Candidatus Kapabacteria bacterium]